MPANLSSDMMLVRRLFHRIAISIGYASSWLFLIAVGISSFEVIMRYGFNSPSSWAHETTTTLCVIAFGFGGAYCMARNEHIRITSFSEKLNLRTQRLFDLISFLVGIFYLCGLGWGLWLQAKQSVWRFGAIGWTPELVPGPPHWPLPAIAKAALLISALLFLTVVVERLFEILRPRKE